MIYLDSPLFNVSSTLVRENLKNGKDINEFLPKEVVEFINENKLKTELNLPQLETCYQLSWEIFNNYH